MSRNLKQPVTQVLFTNVVYVRMKVKRKRFEIACYPNKVNEYRKGIEKDLDEVLQSEQVYTNASRGIIASEKELLVAFDTTDHEIACEHILTHGEVQISKRERKAEMEKTFKEIASIITEKCINKESRRPFPQAVIEESMRELQKKNKFSINFQQSSKAMALALIPKLTEILPLERTQMRLRLTFPGNSGKGAKRSLDNFISEYIAEHYVGNHVYEVLIDPGHFRAVSDVVSKLTKGKGTTDILENDLGGEGVEEEIDGWDPNGGWDPMGGW